MLAACGKTLACVRDPQPCHQAAPPDEPARLHAGHLRGPDGVGLILQLSENKDGGSFTQRRKEDAKTQRTQESRECRIDSDA